MCPIFERLLDFLSTMAITVISLLLTSDRGQTVILVARLRKAHGEERRQGASSGGPPGADAAGAP